MTSELLQQVRVINPVSGTDSQPLDVLITNGVVSSVQERISDYPNHTQIRDCRGLVLGSGLVDLYSHSGEPGFEERETLDSLIAAARAGGFTRLNILPDTNPRLDNPAVLVSLQQKGLEARGWGLGERGLGAQGAEGTRGNSPSASSAPLLSFWGALTLGVEGEQMTELAELAATPGLIGFADGQPLKMALMRRVLEYLKPLGKPIALYPCNRQLVGNGVMREGSYSMRFGLPGNPAIAQTTALAELLELVAAIGTSVHIMRVSTARAVQLIEQAKAQGLPITASTTWMHLLLDTRAISSYNTSLRLEPPLGNPEDLVALRRGVRTGIIDAIAIDHTPYTYEEKTVAFAEAPAGAIGLELALPLLWQHLVETGEFSALELWRTLSSRPIECLQHSKQSPDAWGSELILFDPQQPWVVERQTLKSGSHNTPWLGQKILGRVVKTWLGARG